MTGPKPAPAAYEVGYKKPPAATRFKKGVSGNRHGRPRQQPEFVFKKVLMQELCKVVTVPMNGKMEKMSMIQVLGKDLIKKALTGNKDANKRLHDFIQACNHEFPPVQAESEEIAKFKASLLEHAKEICGGSYKEPKKK